MLFRISVKQDLDDPAVAKRMVSYYPLSIFATADPSKSYLTETLDSIKEGSTAKKNVNSVIDSDFVEGPACR